MVSMETSTGQDVVPSNDAYTAVKHKGALSRLRIWFVGAVVICSAYFLLHRYYFFPVVDNEIFSGLEVPSGALDIGEVWETEEFNWTVPIKNRSGNPIEIAWFSKSCSCVAIEPESFTIQAGETREIRLKIDLASNSASSTRDLAVSLSPRLKTDSDGAAIGPEWKVSGRILRAISLTGRGNFGRHSEFEQPLPIISTSIGILEPLASLSATCNSPDFTASIDFSPHNTTTATLRLAAKSPLPVGKFGVTVGLHPVLKDGKALPVRHVQFEGEILPDVESAPPTLQVGGRYLNETIEETIALRSLTGRHITVVRTEVVGEGIAVESVAEGRYRIRQIVCKVGTQTNYVRLIVNSGGNQYTVSIPVIYTGFATQ